VSRPQVIDDQEHERVHDRVAAIDVAKDSGMVCTRTSHPSRPGARRSTVWTVKARTGAVRAGPPARPGRHRHGDPGIYPGYLLLEQIFIFFAGQGCRVRVRDGGARARARAW
jgi:hypothetical protein